MMNSEEQDQQNQAAVQDSTPSKQVTVASDQLLVEKERCQFLLQKNDEVLEELRDLSQSGKKLLEVGQERRKEEQALLQMKNHKQAAQSQTQTQRRSRQHFQGMRKSQLSLTKSRSSSIQNIDVNEARKQWNQGLTQTPNDLYPFGGDATATATQNMVKTQKLRSKYFFNEDDQNIGVGDETPQFCKILKSQDDDQIMLSSSQVEDSLEDKILSKKRRSQESSFNDTPSSTLVNSSQRYQYKIQQQQQKIINFKGPGVVLPPPQQNNSPFNNIINSQFAEIFSKKQQHQEKNIQQQLPIEKVKITPSSPQQEFQQQIHISSTIVNNQTIEMQDNLAQLKAAEAPVLTLQRNGSESPIAKPSGINGGGVGVLSLTTIESQPPSDSDTGSSLKKLKKKKRVGQKHANKSSLLKLLPSNGVDESSLIQSNHSDTQQQIANSAMLPPIHYPDESDNLVENEDSCIVSVSGTHGLRTHICDDDEKASETCSNGRFLKHEDCISQSPYRTIFRGYDNESGCEIAWNVYSLENVDACDREKINLILNHVKELKHPNILTCKYFMMKETELVMITELITAGSIREYLKKIKLPRLIVIKNWSKKILEGVLYLHSQNFIHGKLTCESIYINSNNGDIKIGDIGVRAIPCYNSKYSELSLCKQVKNCEETTKLDIYCFGLSLLELISSDLSGAKAFQILCKIINKGEKQRVLSSILDDKLRDIISISLETDPEKRASLSDLLTHPFLQKSENDHHPVLFSVQLSELIQKYSHRRNNNTTKISNSVMTNYNNPNQSSVLDSITSSYVLQDRPGGAVCLYDKKIIKQSQNVTPAAAGTQGPSKVKGKLPSNNYVLSSDCGGTESDASANKLPQRTPAFVHYNADTEPHSQVLQRNQPDDQEQTSSFAKQMKQAVYFANQKPSTCKHKKVRGQQSEEIQIQSQTPSALKINKAPYGSSPIHTQVNSPHTIIMQTPSPTTNTDRRQSASPSVTNQEQSSPRQLSTNQPSSTVFFMELKVLRNRNQNLMMVTFPYDMSRDTPEQIVEEMKADLKLRDETQLRALRNQIQKVVDQIIMRSSLTPNMNFTLDTIRPGSTTTTAMASQNQEYRRRQSSNVGTINGGEGQTSQTVVHQDQTIMTQQQTDPPMDSHIRDSTTQRERQISSDNQQESDQLGNQDTEQEQIANEEEAIIIDERGGAQEHHNQTMDEKLYHHQNTKRDDDCGMGGQMIECNVVSNPINFMNSMILHDKNDLNDPECERSLKIIDQSSKQQQVSILKKEIEDLKKPRHSNHHKADDIDEVSEPEDSISLGNLLYELFPCYKDQHEQLYKQTTVNELKNSTGMPVHQIELIISEKKEEDLNRQNSVNNGKIEPQPKTPSMNQGNSLNETLNLSLSSFSLVAKNHPDSVSPDSNHGVKDKQQLLICRSRWGQHTDIDNKQVDPYFTQEYSTIDWVDCTDNNSFNNNQNSTLNKLSHLHPNPAHHNPQALVFGNSAIGIKHFQNQLFLATNANNNYCNHLQNPSNNLPQVSAQNVSSSIDSRLQFKRSLVNFLKKQRAIGSSSVPAAAATAVGKVMQGGNGNQEQKMALGVQKQMSMAHNIIRNENESINLKVVESSSDLKSSSLKMVHEKGSPITEPHLEEEKDIDTFNSNWAKVMPRSLISNLIDRTSSEAAQMEQTPNFMTPKSPNNPSDCIDLDSQKIKIQLITSELSLAGSVPGSYSSPGNDTPMPSMGESTLKHELLQSQSEQHILLQDYLKEQTDYKYKVMNSLPLDFQKATSTNLSQQRAPPNQPFDSPNPRGNVTMMRKHSPTNKLSLGKPLVEVQQVTKQNSFAFVEFQHKMSGVSFPDEELLSPNRNQSRYHVRNLVQSQLIPNYQEEIKLGNPNHSSSPPTDNDFRTVKKLSEDYFNFASDNINNNNPSASFQHPSFIQEANDQCQQNHNQNFKNLMRSDRLHRRNKEMFKTDIATLQEAMKRIYKEDDVGQAGHFCDKLSTYVKKFQETFNYQQDGVVDRQLWSNLMNEAIRTPCICKNTCAINTSSIMENQVSGANSGQSSNTFDQQSNISIASPVSSQQIDPSSQQQQFPQITENCGNIGVFLNCGSNSSVDMALVGDLQLPALNPISTNKEIEQTETTIQQSPDQPIILDTISLGNEEIRLQQPEKITQHQFQSKFVNINNSPSSML